MTLWAYNFPFKILGCDEFTQIYYMEKHNKKFPLSGFEDPPSNDKNSKLFYLKFRYDNSSIQWIW
jgi:hypothetical protein